MTDTTDLKARLRKGVPEVGLHEDNCTELFDVDGASETMFEAADALDAKDRTIAGLREALEQISAEYENPNLSHKDFRVGTRLLADCALRAIAQEQSK